MEPGLGIIDVFIKNKELDSIESKSIEEKKKNRTNNIEKMMWQARCQIIFRDVQ